MALGRVLPIRILPIIGVRPRLDAGSAGNACLKREDQFGNTCKRALANSRYRSLCTCCLFSLCSKPRTPKQKLTKEMSLANTRWISGGRKLRPAARRSAASAPWPEWGPARFRREKETEWALNMNLCNAFSPTIDHRPLTCDSKLLAQVPNRPHSRPRGELKAVLFVLRNTRVEGSEGKGKWSTLLTWTVVPANAPTERNGSEVGEI